MIRILSAAILLSLSTAPLVAQTQQGQALFDQGRYDDAKRLLTPQSNDPRALFTLGRIAMIQNDEGAAVNFFERAVARRPQDSNYHYWLAQAYGEQAQKANVLWQASLAMRTKTELERAVQLDPKNIDAREGLLEYYLRAPAFMGGSDERARQQATEIQKRDPIAGHEAVARLYSHQKKASLALDEYVAAVREQPNAAKTHYNLGVFYLTEKNYEIALDEMNHALKIDPDFMPAVFEVGHLAVLSSNDLLRGEKALQRYLSYKPRPDEPPLGRAYYWLGVLYEKSGRKVEARQNYLAALKLIPHARDVAEALRRVS